MAMLPYPLNPSMSFQSLCRPREVIPLTSPASEVANRKVSLHAVVGADRAAACITYYPFFTREKHRMARVNQTCHSGGFNE